MVKYANWDVVVGSFSSKRAAALCCVSRVDWYDWCSRRGPKEAARWQEAAQRQEASDLAGFRIDIRDGVPVVAGPDEIMWMYANEVLADLRTMADWYGALPEREKAKLTRMTFEEAKRASDAWHRREAARHQTTIRRYTMGAHQRLFDEAMRDGRPVGIDIVDPATGESVRFGRGETSLPLVFALAVGEGERFPVPGDDALYWCRLETEDAYRQESARMANCVGWASTHYRRSYVGKAFLLASGRSGKATRAW